MIKIIRFIVVYVLLTAAALYINLHSDASVPINRPFSEFPLSINGWHMVSDMRFSQDLLNVLRPTDYLSRQYAAASGETVNLYVGFHGGGKEGGEIHSPKHCLPGSGWSRVSTGKESMNVGNRKLELVKAVYQMGESRALFLYWFQVRGKSITDEYSLKMAEIMNSVLYRRRDAAFVRVSVSFEGDEYRAMKSAARFIEDFYPSIQDFLPS